MEARAPLHTGRWQAARLLQSIAVNGVLSAVCLLVLMPILLMVSTSIKAPGETQANRGLIPRQIELGKFGEVWQMVNVPQLALNSIIITAATVILVLLLGSMAAYAFARMDFFARTPLYFAFLIGLMIPTAALIVPLHQLNVRFGLMNTHAGVIGPYVALGLPFCILLLRSYFRSLPRELEEAALIDGASRFTIYWSIFLPLSKPALTTVGIFEALASWNDFLLPLLFLTQNEMRTLPLGTILFTTSVVLTRYEHQFALLVMMTIPVIVVLLFLQRHFVSGLTAGAVKS